MSLDTPSFQQIDGSSFRFAIAAACYNEALVNALVREAGATLAAAGAPAPLVERVPGSAELPFAASVLAESGEFDAIIVIGMVIAGDTNHHNVIGDSTAITLQQLAVQAGLPIINGIIVVDTQQQAEARAGSAINRGKEFAETALAMAAYTRKWKNKNNP